ncbi:hypothetical protein [Candidatus Weimeria sp. HCP3S3_B5]|uniref:hypothetical protein n=1 Tax=Candidatus Weimeria sp. HCP3S3_B5 TaxID=3438871 RepID=UPI002A943506|nr:hypothetical protein [Lachnospiraceae bacterium]MDY6351919.1 hypothetical protein [Lachnospiraceae bacterium]
MKIWYKLVRNNHMIKDTTVCDDSADTRTHKIMRGTEEACHRLDTGIPIWLDVNIREFKRFARTRFTKDSFVEGLDADYLEIEVIEED